MPFCEYCIVIEAHKIDEYRQELNVETRIELNVETYKPRNVLLNVMIIELRRKKSRLECRINQEMYY